MCGAAGWTIVLLFVIFPTFSHQQITQIKVRLDNDTQNFHIHFPTSFKLKKESHINRNDLETYKENESYNSKSVTDISNNKSLENRPKSVIKGNGSIISDNVRNGKTARIDDSMQQKVLTTAIEYGFKSLEELVQVKEPYWHKLGLYLKDHDPAARVSQFGATTNPYTLQLSRIGYATLEASRKIAESLNEYGGRQSPGVPLEVQARISIDDCPLQGRPRCSPSTWRFRSMDGTCNNLQHPWRGSAMLPMQRFLPPVYEDGIQSVRRSVDGSPLPSPRRISTLVHADRNRDIQSVTLMFTQWGQFIDHDITSTVRSRSFNGSIPRCCDNGGSRVLPSDLLHPSCLPIEVPSNDPFFRQFGIGCMEFIRNAPSTRLDCQLGWREQINQVTPYLDGSTIYGSNVDTLDFTRTFSNGKLFYGVPQSQRENFPDLPDENLCQTGAISEDCLRAGDGRLGENPALVAMHTIFVRYHNNIADLLGEINPHWKDERLFQETRRIVSSVMQHITYREYLPIVLGPDVMDLFELRTINDGYYKNYSPKVSSAIANSFSTAAFRFGHSMVQNSYIRATRHHTLIFNNVSLHDELSNSENIWSIGSIDRLILGMIQQPSQRRDEYIAEELTNHLFQFSAPFGMDLAAINIQRGRDHGISPYTSWRQPCGLKTIKNWKDMEEVMHMDTVVKLRSLYNSIDDVDLFTGGLAEKPLRGAVVGPTFACIIAQQFVNLRKGDRFWYENGNFESSFTVNQLNQIRQVSMAQVICQTMDEVDTVQPFVFLSADSFRNIRTNCNSHKIGTFDLSAWTDRDFDASNNIADRFDNFLQRSKRSNNSNKKKKKHTNSGQQQNVTNKKSLTKKLTKIKVTSTNKPESAESKYSSVQSRPIKLQAPNNDLTYLVGVASTKRPKPIKDDITYMIGVAPIKRPTQPPVQVNINIQYITPTRKRPQIAANNYQPTYDTVIITGKPNTYTDSTTRRPIKLQQTYNGPTNRPQFLQNFDYAVSNGLKRPNSNGLNPWTRLPNYETYHATQQYRPTTAFEDSPFAVSTQQTNQNYYNRPGQYYDRGDEFEDDITDQFFERYVDNLRNRSSVRVNDKLDFRSTEDGFVKISSVKRVENFSRLKRTRRDGEPKDVEGAIDVEIPVLPTNFPCSYEIPKPMINVFSALENSDTKTL